MQHPRLTEYLVSRFALGASHTGQRDPSKLWNAAVHHPFLVKAGKGVLADTTLARWFAQDIHYTRAYIQFIGGLLSRLRLPTSIRVNSSTATHEKNIHHRAFDVLVAALTGIQREMQFFEDTIRKYGLESTTFSENTQHMEPHTKAYVDLLQSVGHGSASLLEGLTVLWGTEYVYLQAWSFAKTHEPAEWASTEQKAACQNARAALHETLITNWSSPEFASFVDECRSVLDDLAQAEQIDVPSSPASVSDRVRRVQEWFDQVVWLEGNFWPSVD